MLPPTRTEIMKLNHFSLIGNYRIHRYKYVYEGQTIVHVVRKAIENAMMRQTMVTANYVYNITQDEVYSILKDWLPNCERWMKKLRSKWGLPFNDYDPVTDSMARYIAWDAYNLLIQ
jgi:hypothetical protein